MPTISTYFSISYISLLMMAVLFYAISSKKIRRWILLLFSYLFFYAVSGKLLCYLLFSTLSIHHIGLWLSVVQNECDQLVKNTEIQNKKELKEKSIAKQRYIIAFAVILHIGLLAMLKYTPFLTNNINNIFQFIGITYNVTIPSFLVPIGISFYTLQAVSYLFDVYRRKYPADRNLLRLALFMSFFPQIMEGPICRYTDTANSLWYAEKIKYSNFIAGSQRILFGIMKKLIIADRLNLLIRNVFLEYDKYDGFVIALSAILYTLQLYMDFSGTMDVALGSAQIFGIKLPENFQRPFFSRTISEFWKRWHITLGTWFKDYIFFPLSMSKPLKKLSTFLRKKLNNYYGTLISSSIALFCVWLYNGIWHGAGWHFIFFGMYHFILILGGNIIEPSIVKITKRLNINRKSLPYRILQIIRTGILVCIGELFFRSHGLSAGLRMFKKIITDFSLATLKDGTLFSFGMDKKDYFIVVVAVVLIFIISILQERGVNIRQAIARRNIVIQYTIYLALIMFIIIFGAYGTGYIPLDPIYANF